jgi:hypothetical protein
MFPAFSQRKSPSGAPTKFVPQYRPSLSSVSPTAKPELTTNLRPFPDVDIAFGVSKASTPAVNHESDELDVNLFFPSAKLSQKSAKHVNFSSPVENDQPLAVVVTTDTSVIPPSGSGSHPVQRESSIPVLTSTGNFDIPEYYFQANPIDGSLTVEKAPSLLTPATSFSAPSSLRNSRKRKTVDAVDDDGQDDEDLSGNEEPSTSSISNKVSRSKSSSSSSSSPQKRKKSKKQQVTKSLFPVSYLQLLHYTPLQPSEQIPHKRILTHLKLSPAGIAGIHFSNYDSRAVITSISSSIFNQSANSKYCLQLYDMVLSVNHLDAKYSSYEQIINALHHTNETWDIHPSGNTSSASSVIIPGIEESTASVSSSTSAFAAVSSNTNIYVNDMNDPNYHSNRTSLKNAIIESMACVVFARVV